MTKVLTDVNVSRAFKNGLTDALGLPDAVHGAVEKGWKTKRNGDLQDAAKAAGFTHLVTCDKDMANRHEPRLPVLVIDNPSHGEEGRTPGDMSAAEVMQMTLATASAVADVLIRDPPTHPGYYGVAVQGYKPRKQLQIILDGKHKQHPDYSANRERHAQEQRAKGRRRRGHGSDMGTD